MRFHLWKLRTNINPLPRMAAQLRYKIMRTEIEKTLTITLTEKECKLLDMILCDYENEESQHNADDYSSLNKFSDEIRCLLQEIYM